MFSFACFCIALISVVQVVLASRINNLARHMSGLQSQINALADELREIRNTASVRPSAETTSMSQSTTESFTGESSSLKNIS